MWATVSNASAPARSVRTRVRIRRHQLPRRSQSRAAAAATHPGGPLLVLAGAGTGKTTTLAARVAWLIDQGAAPERVLLVTFTRRAAREMLGARARTWGARRNGRHAGRVVGGTFHSVAHRFVRRHAAALGLPRRLRRARRRRRRRPAGPRAPGGRRRPDRAALPAQVDAARRLLAHGQRPAAAARAAGRGLPVVRAPRRRPRAPVRRLRRAQARARGDRPRRPAALLARAGPGRGGRGAAERRASTTCSSTSTRTSTGCRSTSSAACAASAPTSPSWATTCRPYTASARPRPSTSSPSPSTSPAPRW